MKDGYVIEYITHSIDHPNGGFESDPEYLDVANEHPKLAGRLIAVHRLRPTMRPLREVLGDKEFEHLQDMWAQEGKAPSLVGHVSHHRELRNPGEAAGNGGPEFGRLQAAVPALVQHTSAGK
jgi:hypothetical protein